MGIPIVEGRGFTADRRRRRAGGDRQRDVRAHVLSRIAARSASGCGSGSATATRGSPSSASPRTSSRAASIRRPAPSSTSTAARRSPTRSLFAPPQMHLVLRSDRPAAVAGHGRRRPCCPRRRRGAAVGRAERDGRGVRRLDPPAAAARPAARDVRRPGAAARRHRHLRRARLHGHRATPRDRHPDGAGRQPAHGGRRRHAPGTEPGRRRHRAWVWPARWRWAGSSRRCSSA